MVVIRLLIRFHIIIIIITIIIIIIIIITCGLSTLILPGHFMPSKSLPEAPTYGKLEEGARLCGSPSVTELQAASFVVDRLRYTAWSALAATACRPGGWGHLRACAATGEGGENCQPVTMHVILIHFVYSGMIQ